MLVLTGALTGIAGITTVINTSSVTTAAGVAAITAISGGTVACMGDRCDEDCEDPVGNLGGGCMPKVPLPAGCGPPPCDEQCSDIGMCVFPASCGASGCECIDCGLAEDLEC